MRTRFTLLLTLVSMVSLALVLGGCKKEPKKKADTEESDKDKDKDKDKDDSDDDDDKGKKKKKKEDAPKAAKRTDEKANDDVIKKFMDDKAAEPTADIWKEFMLSLQGCELKKFGAEFKCEANYKYREAMKRKTWWKARVKRHPVAMKLINHKSPTVRYYSVGYVSTFQNEGMTALVNAGQTEDNAIVLARIVSTLGSRVKNTEAKELLVKLADHKDADVRRAVMTAFTGYSAKGQSDLFDIALKKVDSDSDMFVRAHICGRLYNTGDKRGLKVIKKYLDDEKSDLRMYKGCFTGLVNAWVTASLFMGVEPSQDAYQHTLKLLRKTPRDKEHPPWAVFSTLGMAEENSKYKHRQKWYDKVKGWYKAETLRKVLAEIIVDENVYWIGRTSAVRSYKTLGATKKDLKALKKKLGKGKDDNFVVKAIKTAMKKKK